MDLKCENENGLHIQIQTSNNPAKVQNHIFHMKISVVAILTELLVSISFHSEYDDMSVMHLSIIKSNWDAIYIHIYVIIYWDELAECKNKRQPRPTKGPCRVKKIYNIWKNHQGAKKLRRQLNANYSQTKYNGIRKWKTNAFNIWYNVNLLVNLFGRKKKSLVHTYKPKWIEGCWRRTRKNRTRTHLNFSI